MKKTHSNALEWNLLYTNKVGKGRLEQEAVLADLDDLQSYSIIETGRINEKMKI